jgi:hypothetical protein
VLRRTLLYSYFCGWARLTVCHRSDSGFEAQETCGKADLHLFKVEDCWD